MRTLEYYERYAIKLIEKHIERGNLVVQGLDAANNANKYSLSSIKKCRCSLSFLIIKTICDYGSYILVQGMI